MIVPGDRCDGCGRDLFDYKGLITACPNCDAQFCEVCFAKIQGQTDAQCPSCGKDPSSR
jgi:hypothetical protein